MEIVPEAPGGKLISKSGWGKDEKRGEVLFLISLGGGQKGGQLTFYSILSGGKSMLAAMSGLSYS